LSHPCILNPHPIRLIASVHPQASSSSDRNYRTRVSSILIRPQSSHSASSAPSDQNRRHRAALNPHPTGILAPVYTQSSSDWNHYTPASSSLILIQPESIATVYPSSFVRLESSPPCIPHPRPTQINGTMHPQPHPNPFTQPIHAIPESSAFFISSFSVYDIRPKLNRVLKMQPSRLELPISEAMSV
jgi:hypothetical protein